MSFGRDTSWRDIGRELTERAQRERAAQAAAAQGVVGAETPVPSAGREAAVGGPVVETSENWGLPHPSLDVGIDEIQLFRFVPNAAPRAHQLTVVMNSGAMFEVMLQMANHLRDRTPGPLQLVMVGGMTLESLPDTDDAADEDADHTVGG